jgi:glucose-1-phosphate thymidylyltransferase
MLTVAEGRPGDLVDCGIVAYKERDVMKGLILAAGLGTRLRPLTSLRPKSSIPVANRPLLAYAIEALVDAGVSDVGIIVSPETIGGLKQTVERLDLEVPVTFVTQDEPRGLAHAVETAQPYLGDDPFVMYLADNLFERDLRAFVAHYRPGVSAVMGLIEVSDPRSFGVAEVDGDRVTALVEKPEQPRSNLAVAGVYVFGPEIHEAIDGLQPGAKGEYQITDAVQRLVERGDTVLGVQLEGWWKDTGRPPEILAANRLLLGRLPSGVSGTVGTNVNASGAVVVGEGATVQNATLVGPVVIGEGAVVEDATIGPDVSLGAGSTVRGATLQDSVIGERCLVADVGAPLVGTLMGNDVRVVGGGPEGHALVLGDHAQVTLR